MRERLSCSLAAPDAREGDGAPATQAGTELPPGRCSPLAQLEIPGEPANFTIHDSGVTLGWTTISKCATWDFWQGVVTHCIG